MSHRSGDSITPCPSSTPKLQDYANLEMVNPDLASDMGSSQFTMSSPCASMSVSNPLLARIWCTVADMFLKAGKTSDALSCVREAQFLAPHFPSVLLSYGCVMQASDNERRHLGNCIAEPWPSSRPI
eukprot:Em0001g2514a